MRGERLERLRQEILRALEGLPETSRFDLVFFRRKVSRFRDDLSEATEKRLRSARQYVARQPATGATNLYGGLASALGVRHVGAERHPRRRLPDQVIVLSDGLPSFGRLQSADEILEEVRRINHDGTIRFDTVAIGRPSDLLRQLAEENGGEYRHLR